MTATVTTAAASLALHALQGALQTLARWLVGVAAIDERQAESALCAGVRNGSGSPMFRKEAGEGRAIAGGGLERRHGRTYLLFREVNDER